MVASCCLKTFLGVAVVVCSVMPVDMAVQAKTEGNWHQRRRSAPAYGYWMGLLAARRQGRKDEGMAKIPPPGGGGRRFVEVFEERRLSSRFPAPRAQEPAGLNLALTLK